MNRLRSLGLFFALLAAPALAQDAQYLTPRTTTTPGFQYTPSPSDWRDINIYQLFTDRFANGDDDSYIKSRNWYSDNRAWPAVRNFHHGGDWKGLKNNLDYLSGMGVRALWISGVQMNDQGRDKNYTPYHMYHPTDFYRVDPAMGTFQDLKDLIDACHARGIYVILDVVINHMADKNGLPGNNFADDKQYWPNGYGNFVWWDSNNKHAAPFNDLQWFHNNGTINNWDAYPENVLGQFKGTDDLKTESAQVQTWLGEAFKNLISATDCDGFRVDAIKHVEKSWCLQWADDMRKHAASLGKNDFILFGEYFSYDNGALASYVTTPGSFNSALFFPMANTIKSVFVDGQWTGQLSQALAAKSQYGEGENRLVAFIDNHDLDRIGLKISQSGDTGRINYVMKPALTWLYTGTPVPCLFYGTEHGFNQGGHYNGSDRTQDNPDDGDWQRECMFDKGFQPGPAAGDQLTQTSAPLYQHIKALNQARKDYPALTRGNFTERWQSGSAGPYAFSRVNQDQEALVAFNTADGTQSINPQVGKVDGTQFTNVLNPTEKVTVSGGRISFSLSGKESKIFVAGAVARPSSATLTSNATDISITYTPNDGPLKSATAPVKIGLKIDGGTETFVPMTAGTNGAWTYTRPFAGINTSLVVTFRDSAATPLVDNNGGAGWTFDATKFGQSAIGFVGNTSTYPAEGSITASSDLYVDFETWPQNAATGGNIWYTADGGATWLKKAIGKNGTKGNNDKWNCNLGRFTPGTTVRFAVEAVDVNGVSKWDNNGSKDYTRAVQYGTVKVTYLGGTYHWPANGSITSTDNLWVNIESYPQGAGVNGEVIYSTDSGKTWRSAVLSLSGTIGQNDLWHANLGTFPSGSTVKYAVKLVDTTGGENWDNLGGANFTATVNGQLSSLTRFDAPQTRGRIDAVKPQIALEQGANGLVIKPSGRGQGNRHVVLDSTNLVDWTTNRVVEATDAAEAWDVIPAADMATNTKRFYKVRAEGAESERIYAENPSSFSIRVNKDGARYANLVYSADGGLNWLSGVMAKVGSDGTNDVWSVEIPGKPAGSLFKYAVELVDQQTNSHWVNNGGADYTANVVRPGQTDFTAPVASHSPANTTTTANSLQVTLSATDNADPAPKIYYTTDGTNPTLASTRYTTPITVTNTSTGVDMTIKYFAIDADANQSNIQTVEVRVGQTQNFGPNKPYSTNPTLGTAVANGSITLDGANTASKWHDGNLVAIGMANDDPRSLGSNWTMHESPINLTHIWASWDDSYLYLAWQFVDVTDIVDPANAGGAGSGRIGSNDGILQWIALDTKPNEGATKDVWSKNKDKAGVVQPLWTGPTKPDVQIYLAGSLWQGYASRAVNGVFAVDDGGVNYFKIADAGITAAKGATFAGTSLWGVNDADDRRNGDAPNRNFFTLGHNWTRDSFYEIKIPLSFLGLTKAQLESQGIGVMIGAGSNSCMDVLPQDDGATLNTQGVETWNSSLEWGDVDSITSPFARIGAW